MLCNKCKKNEATYYMEQNINGKVTKIALCHECAKEYNGFSFNPFGEFNLLGGLFNTQPTQRPQTTEKKRCTLCASSFDEIVKNGRVGCAKCYEVFKDELEPTIRRIHGNVKHAGRCPMGHAPKDDGKKETVIKNETANEISDLRNKLNEAVAREDYETAAKLRDQIRSMSDADGAK